MDLLKTGMIALLVAWAVVWFGMPKFLPLLQRLHFGQAIREEGPQSHLKKSGTPTMGGILIQIGILVSCLIVFFAFGYDIILPLAMTIGFGLIGFIDDFLIVKRHTNEGLKPWQKLLMQFVLALLFAVLAYHHKDIGSEMRIPFTGSSIDFGIFYIPFTFFAIVAMVNAVNLTDGLDGLAAGASAIVTIFFFGASLMLTNLPGAAFSGALMGSCLGFLGHNSNPADVFMGDTGSMALGGGIVALGIITGLQLYLLIAGILFVIEALSVVIQVGYFKISGGKRVFRMAPIHHHYELKGWKETRVVAVFWVVAAISVACAFIAF